jgi:hypothetical protein
MWTPTVVLDISFAIDQDKDFPLTSVFGNNPLPVIVKRFKQNCLSVCKENLADKESTVCASAVDPNYEIYHPIIDTIPML